MSHVTLGARAARNCGAPIPMSRSLPQVQRSFRPLGREQACSRKGLQRPLIGRRYQFWGGARTTRGSARRKPGQLGTTQALWGAQTLQDKLGCNPHYYGGSMHRAAPSSNVASCQVMQSEARRCRATRSKSPSPACHVCRRAACSPVFSLLLAQPTRSYWSNGDPLLTPPARTTVLVRSTPAADVLSVIITTIRIINRR